MQLNHFLVCIYPYVNFFRRLPALLTLLGVLFGTLQPLQAADFKNLSAEDKEAVGEFVREYILDNPEIIFDALARYEFFMKQQLIANYAAKIDEYSEVLFNSPYAWAGGNLDGDISIIEFLDYRCGFCREAFELVNSVITSDGNIRYIVKEFPILGEDSYRSAQMALAIRELSGDTAYKVTHDYLMTLTEPISDKIINKIAKDNGILPQELTQVADSDIVTEAINETYTLANIFEINGTPTFIIGNSIYRGFLGIDELEKAVELARSKQY